MSIEDEAKDLLLKVGLWWPDANSGTLRSAADAWRAFADSVDDVRTPVNNAATSLITNNTGAAIDVFSTFWDRYAKGNDTGWLSDLSKSSREMARALDKFADAIDDAINKLWTQIASTPQSSWAASHWPSSPPDLPRVQLLWPPRR